VGVRLDLGVGWQMVTYDVRSVVVVKESWDYWGETYTDTAWYSDTGDEARFGYYVALTFNSGNPDWPVNGSFRPLWRGNPSSISSPPGR